MKKKWNIADLIDLEFFLNQDSDEDLDSLTARDRKIYSELPSALKKSNPAPPVLLRSWLAARRTGQTMLPGQSWQEILWFFSGVALLSGLFCGGGLALSFLSYSGKEPVNVAAYFAVFVLTQVLLFVVLVCSALFRRIQGRNFVETSLLYGLLRHLFTRVFQKVMASMRKRASQKISAETRLKWSSYTASLQQIHQRYGPLLLRPFFLIVQVFGVSFNAGVLAATLFKVIGADLAFGWQSTLQVTPASVHNLVHWIALPWSWLPSNFIPTLDQIEGSRLVLKEGIYFLVNADLTSWWPFLCLSVLCYGLLPRLLLLLIVHIQQSRHLAQLNFSQGYFRQTLHRMHTPQLSTAAQVEPCQPQPQPQPLSDTPDIPPSFAGSSAPAPTTSSDPSSSIFQKQEQEQEQEQQQQIEENTPTTAEEPFPSSSPPKLMVLIPDELLPDCPAHGLEQQIQTRLGYTLAAILPFWTLEKSEEEELAVLTTKMKEAKNNDLLILLEAWQPPIEELISWLKLVRQHLGPDALIFLALIGKPNAETLLTPVLPQHIQIWQYTIAKLGDSGLQLIELVKS
ncbi:MAG: DUF2868 domain-containing protein [Candidatus Electrothrix sp. AW5]|nr:DUF2868 domain-containing protein [Candidatus Electrothrix gigas]